MGRDCLFVGTLYNKMRVKKDLLSELKVLFEAYADPMRLGLKITSEELQKADAAIPLLCKGLDAEKEAVEAANKAIEEELGQKRKTILDVLENLNGRMAQAGPLARQLLDQATALETAVSNLPRPNIPRCRPFDSPCEKLRDEANKRLDEISKMQNEARQKRDQVRNLGLEHLQESLDLARTISAELDKLEATRKKAVNDSIDTVIAQKRRDLRKAEEALGAGEGGKRALDPRRYTETGGPARLEASCR
jgi:hypothetical protein